MRATVCARLDITRTQVHACNVLGESSKSRSVTKYAAIVKPENIRRRLVSRPDLLVSCARQVNTVRLQDEDTIASNVLLVSTQAN